MSKIESKASSKSLPESSSDYDNAALFDQKANVLSSGKLGSISSVSLIEDQMEVKNEEKNPVETKGQANDSKKPKNKYIRRPKGTLVRNIKCDFRGCNKVYASKYACRLHCRLKHSRELEFMQTRHLPFGSPVLRYDYSLPPTQYPFMNMPSYQYSPTSRTQPLYPTNLMPCLTKPNSKGVPIKPNLLIRKSSAPMHIHPTNNRLPRALTPLQSISSFSSDLPQCLEDLPPSLSISTSSSVDTSPIPGDIDYRRHRNSLSTADALLLNSMVSDLSSDTSNIDLLASHSMTDLSMLENGLSSADLRLENLSDLLSSSNDRQAQPPLQFSNINNDINDKALFDIDFLPMFNKLF